MLKVHFNRENVDQLTRRNHKSTSHGTLSCSARHVRLQEFLNNISVTYSSSVDRNIN